MRLIVRSMTLTCLYLSYALVGNEASHVFAYCEHGRCYPIDTSALKLWGARPLAMYIPSCTTTFVGKCVRITISGAILNAPGAVRLEHVR